MSDSAATAGTTYAAGAAETAGSAATQDPTAVATGAADPADTTDLPRATGFTGISPVNADRPGCSRAAITAGTACAEH